MTGLQDFRQKYPQYNDIPDGELADKLYQKHYSDMPKQEFYARMGMTRDPAAPRVEKSSMAAQAAEPVAVGEKVPGAAQQNIPSAENLDLEHVSRETRRGVGGKIIDAATDVSHGMLDMIRAAGQRTSPVVRNAKGEFIRPYVGEFHENPTDSGLIPMAFGEHGGVRIDPEKMVVLYDPKTKKDQVFLRTEDTNAGLAENLGHMLGAGMVTGSITKLPHGIVTARGGGAEMAAKLAQKTANVKAKAQLLEDFTRTGVRPSQPVISQGKATGTMAQMLGRVPGAAGAIQRNMRKAFDDTVQAVDRVANSFGMPGTRDRAGRIIQGGIERAGKIVEGARNAASLPSRLTSFRTKADALYKQAEGLIGEAATVPMAHTRQALESVLNRTGVASVDALLKNPEVQAIADALKEGGEIPFEAARALRSEVGKLTRSGGEQVLRTLDKAQVNRIYGAMTQDLMQAARAAGGPKAAHALLRADQFYAAGNKRISDSLQKLFKAASPEQAYERLQTMLSEKTAANMQAAYALKRTLRPEEWNDIASTVIERMGRPTAGAASNLPGEEGFSIARFVSEYNKLSEKGKDVLFGGPLRNEMETLARIASAQKGFEKLANVTASGSHTVSAGFGGLLVYNPILAAKLVAGGRATAELLMSPKFVQWLNAASKIKGDPQMAIHMGNLQKIIENEPQLAFPLQKVLAAGDSDNEDQR